MADAEDDGFPPEVQKEPDEFAFRELSRVKVTSSDARPNYDTVRCHLLAVANNYGYIYVGTPDGIKVYSSSDVLNAAKKNEELCTPLTTIILRNKPNWLALSKDDFILSVCCCSEKGPQILFFDIRNIANSSKPSKTPFHQELLSKDGDDHVTSLMWNPSQEFSNVLAVCLSTGSFFLMTVGDSSMEVSSKPDGFDALSVSWSRDGRYVMVGKKDGTLVQLNQKLEPHRSIPIDNVIDRPVGACDLLWLSSTHIGAAYVVRDDDDSGFNQPNLFLADISKNDVSWRNYEDPCFGMGESRESQYLFEYIEQWNMFVVMCSNSTGTALIAKNKESGVWEIWTLNDSSRAALTFSIYTEDDTAPLGAGLITTHMEKIIVGEAKECGPMPVLIILSDDGVLCLYHVINLSSGYPNLVKPAQQLQLIGERRMFGKKSTNSGGDGIETPATSFIKKLTAKPSLAAMGTPKLGLPQGVGFKTSLPSLQMSSTPLGGKQSISAFNDEPSIIENDTVPKQPLKKSISSKPPLAGLLTVEKPPLAKSVVSEKKKPQPKLEPQPIPKMPPVQSVKPKTTIKRESPALPQRKSNAFTRKEARQTSDIYAAVEDIANFDDELEEFRSSLQDIESCTIEIKDRTEVSQLDSLSSFSDEIGQTSTDTSNEIHDLLTSLQALISEAESVKRRYSSTTRGSYQALLFSRPLDRTQREKLEALEGLYHYIVSSLKEVDASLDDQWKRYNEKIGVSGSKRSLLKDNEWDAAYNSLVSNLKLAHAQEMRIMLLSQQIDRLRIYGATRSTPYTDTKVSSSDLSNDLQSLANTLFMQKHPSTSSDVRQSSETTKKSRRHKISPKKQAELGKFLAKQQVKPIKTSTKRNTSILLPRLPSTKLESNGDSSSPQEEEESDSQSPSVYSSESEAQSAQETPPSSATIPSAVPQGSATLGYGAPADSPKGEFVKRDFKSLPDEVEAASNLNHPPLVVNIQNFQDVQTPSQRNLSLPEKFQPSPKVPIGAVAVMQTVLNTVNAEKQKQDQKKLEFDPNEDEKASSAPHLKFGPQPTPSAVLFNSSTFTPSEPFSGFKLGGSQKGAEIPVTLQEPKVSPSSPPASSAPSSIFTSFAAPVFKPNISSVPPTKPIQDVRPKIPNPSTSSKPPTFQEVPDTVPVSKPVAEVQSSQANVPPSVTENIPKSGNSQPPLLSIASLAGDAGKKADTKQDSETPTSVDLTSILRQSPAFGSPFNKENTVSPAPTPFSLQTASTAEPTKPNSSFLSGFNTQTVAGAARASPVFGGGFGAASSSGSAFGSGFTTKPVTSPPLVSSESPLPVTTSVTSDPTPSTVRATEAPTTSSSLQSSSIFSLTSSSASPLASAAQPIQSGMSVFGASQAAPSVFAGSSGPFGSTAVSSTSNDTPTISKPFGMAMEDNASPAPEMGFGPLSLGTPAPQERKTSAFGGNPFAFSSQEQSSNTGMGSSLFGNTPQSAFGSLKSPTSTAPAQGFGAFGANPSTGQGFGSFSTPGPTTSQGFGFGTLSSGSSPGFGLFNKPKNQFGGAPTFGSGAVFGGQASFGSPPGGSVFGSQAASQSSVFGQSTGQSMGTSGFASFAKNESLGFGNLASQGSGGFGSQQSSATPTGFGAAAKQQSPSFTGWR